VTVTSEQLEACLERARARVGEPRLGLFGPASMVWHVNREQLLFLAGTRAVLLQEAHPYVAHGVDQHSRTKTDPIGRFERTFRHVHAMLFGDLDSALASARRVHRYHATIRGTITERTGAYAAGAAYEANDEAALLWVHATLWESSITAYELLFRPLTESDKERYYQETKLFAYMFGIADETLPPTWPDFVAYNERMWRSDELGVEHTARSMAEFILSPTNPLHRRFAGINRVVTAGLLPARFRAAYGLAFGARERIAYSAAVRAARASWRVLPRAQRFVPAYLHACARVGRGVAPTVPERIVTRLWPASAKPHG
jgi:uncharacterized protein (DUF2236 family)